MALEMVFWELLEKVEKLEGAFRALRQTVVEDRPPRGDVSLVDQLGDAVEDVLGWLREALSPAADAEKAVGHPPNLDQARRALARCQEYFHKVQQRFAADLVSYERVRELMDFGNQRRGEWLAWAGVVRHGLDQCREPLDDVSQALVLCWQELAERLGTTSISVQATNIGQQISVPEGKEAVGESPT